MRFQIGMGQTEGLKKYRELAKGSGAHADRPQREEGERRDCRQVAAVKAADDKKKSKKSKRRTEEHMAAEQITEKIGHKNEKIGEVVSTKMSKTIVVEVTRRVPHPLYKRIVTKRKKFYAHDEQETAKVGRFRPDHRVPSA